MHPALSIIFFTATAGAGYGLLSVAALASAGVGGMQATSAQLLITGIAGLVAVTAGLLASSLHLANPRNAWRAFSRFRSSWLSREAVLSVLFYPVALAWLAGVWAEAGSGLMSVLALLTVVMALATVFSTAMIYACLRTIPQWHTGLTPLNFLLLSLMIGVLGYAAVADSTGNASDALLWASVGFVAAAGGAKIVCYIRFRVPAGPTIAQATGLGPSHVRLFDVGHTAGTFLTREFGFQVARSVLTGLRIVVLALAFVVPAAVLWLELGNNAPSYSMPAGWLSAYLGLLIERWLFFAEARHVVNLYHGASRV